MDLFVWMAAAIFGATALGFVAGYFAAHYEPPERPMMHVHAPMSHVTVLFDQDTDRD